MATIDIVMTQNNDITVRFTARDSTGNPVNITDFTILWEVKKSYLSAALITKSTGGHGITITNTTGGNFTVALAAADTKTLEPGSYLHQATLTDTFGNSVSLTGLGGTTGVFKLIPQIAVQ